ncbi:putative reverse transcriptase domain-containing protein [Tanacetum coccineum]
MEIEVEQCSIDKKYVEIEKKELLIENERLLEQIISQDIMCKVMHSYDDLVKYYEMEQSYIDEYSRCVQLEAELSRKNDMVEKSVYNELTNRCSRLEKYCISLEIKVKQTQLQANNTSISKLKEHIATLKGKSVSVCTSSVNNANVIAPEMFKLDLKSLSSKLRKNREAHVDYLKQTKEHADTLHEIVEQARVLEMKVRNWLLSDIFKQSRKNSLSTALERAWNYESIGCIYITRNTLSSAGKRATSYVSHLSDPGLSLAMPGFDILLNATSATTLANTWLSHGAMWLPHGATWLTRTRWLWQLMIEVAVDQSRCDTCTRYYEKAAVKTRYEYIPRHAFHLWLVVKRSLKTHDMLRPWDVNGNIPTVLCPLCDSQPDSHEHLFFECVFSKQVWDNLKNLAGIPYVNDSISAIVDFLIPISKRRTTRSVIAKLVVAALTYFIWQERNCRLFKNQKRMYEQVTDCIISTVRLKLLSCSFRKSKDGLAFIHLWKFPETLIRSS